MTTLGTTIVDLFALQISHQINKYVSWKTEFIVMAIDAFSMKRNTFLYFNFPPFSLLGKVATKIVRDQTERMITISKSTQCW